MWGRLGKQLFFRGLDNYYYTRAISYRYRTIMYYTLPDGPPWYLLRSASPPLAVWDESNTKLVSRTDGRVIRIWKSPRSLYLMKVIPEALRGH
jgi:hypothetical protein